jgi:hypothetical protein
MIWDGYRSVVVRTGNLEQHNAAAPAFIDISPKEVEKFMQGVRSEDGEPPATGVPQSPAMATPAAS